MRLSVPRPCCGVGQLLRSVDAKCLGEVAVVGIGDDVVQRLALTGALVKWQGNREVGVLDRASDKRRSRWPVPRGEWRLRERAE